MTVPATTRVQILDAKSPKMSTVLKDILTSSPEPMAALQNFCLANEILISPISKALDKAQLPEVNTEDLDGQIKALDSQLADINKSANEASKAIDDQITELNKQRETVRKPFSDQATGLNTQRGELTKSLDERLNPLRQAIESLRDSLVQQAKNILVKSVLKDKDETTLDAETKNILGHMLTFDVPSAHVAKVVSSTPGVRGRAGASQVRLSKGSEVHEFKSLNAARAFVYQQVNGEPPKYQANANNCASYLAGQGWTVEEIK